MKFEAELARKSIHLLPLSIPVSAVFLDQALVMFVLFSLTFIFLTADAIRLYIRPVGGLFMKIFGALLRDRERRNLVGSTYYLIGASLAFLLFHKPVAITAVTFLVLGDMAAAAVGRRWGKPRFKGKSFEGSLACLIVCSLVALIAPDMPVRPALVGAATATVIEFVSLRIDDNLSIPLISGSVMELLI